MRTRVKREEDHVSAILFQLDVVSLTTSVIGRDRDFEQAMHSLPLLCFVRSIGDLRSILEKGVIAHYQFDVRQSERFENALLIQFCRSGTDNERGKRSTSRDLDRSRGRQKAMKPKHPHLASLTNASTSWTSDQDDWGAVKLARKRASQSSRRAKESLTRPANKYASSDNARQANNGLRHRNRVRGHLRP